MGRHGPHSTTAADTGAERWCVNQANCGGGLAGGGSRACRTRGGRYRDHSPLGARSRLDQIAVLEFSRAATVRDVRIHHATRCASLARNSGADTTGKAASCPVTAFLSAARRRALNTSGSSLATNRPDPMTNSEEQKAKGRPASDDNRTRIFIDQFVQGRTDHRRFARTRRSTRKASRIRRRRRVHRRRARRGRGGGSQPTAS